MNLELVIPVQQTNVITELAYFTARAKDVCSATDVDSPFILRDLTEGISQAQNHMTVATYQLSKIQEQLDKRLAVLRFETFPAFCVEKKLKGTVAEADSFACLDQEIQDLKEALRQQEAWVTYLNTVNKSLITGSDNLKKAVYNRNAATLYHTPYTA
jgi:hypothetical protein